MIDKLPQEKPTASNKIPDNDGPINDPKENIEVHRLDTSP